MLNATPEPTPEGKAAPQQDSQNAPLPEGKGTNARASYWDNSYQYYDDGYDAMYEGT